jgi:flagellar motor switch protein FliM
VSVQTPPQAKAPSGVGGGRKRRRGVVTPYDFRRPTTLAREHTRALEVAFETFARQWSTLLLTRLRQPSTVVLVSVDAISYDEYVRSLPGHGALVTFTPEVGSEPGLLQLSSVTALDCLDLMLGGSGGTSVEEAERELTEIERRLLDDLLVRTLADLAYAFASIIPLDPQLGVIEANPQFLQLAAANDVVVVAGLTIAIGEDAAAEPVTVMLPLAPLVARLLDAGGDRARSVEQLRGLAVASDRLARSVPELPIEVAARFTPMPTHPPEVLALRVGDVLRLSHPTTRPLDVVTNGVVLASAVAGTSGSRLACLVVATGDGPAGVPASRSTPAASTPAASTPATSTATRSLR